MIRPRICSLLCALLLILNLASAEPWNCKAVIDKEHWDFTGLGSEKSITRTRKSPPSTFEDEVRFNICKELGEREGMAKEDQCPAETLACYTETNKKKEDGADGRVTAVIPLASTSTLDVQYKTLTGGKGLTLTLHGPSWPPSSSPSTPQSIRFTLYCPSKEKTEGEPVFKEYSSQTGVLEVEWVVASACPTITNDDGGDNGGEKDGGKDKDKDSTESTGSGIGWFFFLFFFAFLTYFVLGAYYNYNNYGATGWDLVPHRDFWRDVPYLFQDLFSHIVASFRSGGSRSGYVSV